MGNSSSSGAEVVRAKRELRAEYERLQVERQREMQHNMRKLQEQHETERLYGLCGAAALFGICGLGAVHSLRLARMVKSERATVAGARVRLKEMSDELDLVRQRAQRDVDTAKVRLPLPLLMMMMPLPSPLPLLPLLLLPPPGRLVTSICFNFLCAGLLEGLTALVPA